MSELEEKKKRKKRKKAGTESSKESSLRDWFKRKGAKGKKGGWVDCNAPDGKGGYKSCGRSSGEKRKKYPACRPTPGACKERGRGKSWGKKGSKRKRKNESMEMSLEEIKTITLEELEAVLDEKKKKRKKKKVRKKKAKKDACYHKVKSRYDVWPSAYASGALTKCRKVGAKNWGNKSKNEELELNEIELEEKKKKKPCKKAKGKRYVKRVNGRCRSFGQAGKAKGGGDRIRPGTKKGDAYCARSAKIKKCKNPPCANDLSRKKWKCRGSKSMREQNEPMNSPEHDRIVDIIASGQDGLYQALELFDQIKGTGIMQPFEEDHIQRLSDYAEVSYKRRSLIDRMAAIREKFGVQARLHPEWRAIKKERIQTGKDQRELEKQISQEDKMMIRRAAGFA